MKKLIILACLILTVAACGGSSSSGGTPPPAGETAAVANAVVDSALTTMLNLDEEPTANIQAQAQALLTKTLDPLNCIWLDEAGNPITADVANISLVATWVCDDTCDPTGTMTYTISNTTGTPFFVGTPFADGMVNAIEYTDCPITNVCGTNSLNGTITYTATGLLSNPCMATITVVSTDMTLDGSSAATLNLIMNFTGTGDCSTVATFVCDTMLDDTSTMTVGGTTYNKTQICDMIDNGTCT